MGKDIIEENTYITMKGNPTMRGNMGWYLGHLIDNKDILNTCDIKHVIEWNVNMVVNIMITFIISIKEWGRRGGYPPQPPTPILSIYFEWFRPPFS